MKYAVTVFICAILLQVEWFICIGTFKLLSGPLGFYRGTPESVAKRTRARKHFIVAWVGFVWAVTIALFVYIFIIEK